MVSHPGLPGSPAGAAYESRPAMVKTMTETRQKETAMTSDDSSDILGAEAGGTDELGQEAGGTDSLGAEAGGTDILGPEAGGTDELGEEAGGTDVLGRE